MKKARPRSWLHCKPATTLGKWPSSPTKRETPPTSVRPPWMYCLYQKAISTSFARAFRHSETCLAGLRKNTPQPMCRLRKVRWLPAGAGLKDIAATARGPAYGTTRDRASDLFAGAGHYFSSPSWLADPFGHPQLQTC